MAKQIMTHMMPRDVPLFCTYYQTTEGQAYQAWEFDVLVGDPEDPGAFYPDSARRRSLYVNALKIDAVGWFFATPTIIEVKPQGTCGAIGQLVTYKHWYRLNYQRDASIMLVCRRISGQVAAMCLSLDIAVRVIDPAPDYIVSAVERDIARKIEKRSILPLLQATA